jgi:hypothetical protein
MPRSYSITDPTGVLTIDFNETDDGFLVPDTNGVFWSIEELEGWDGPDVRQVLIDPYGIDGVIVGVNEYSSRTLTFSNGFAAAPNEEARWVAESQWGQLLAATVAQGMCHLVVHEDIDRFMDGYIASKPEYKEVPPGSMVGLVNAWPFQLEGSLVCPFPLKQSVNSNSGMNLTRDGTVAIPTLGNYPTWPNFTFDFPVDGDYIADDQGNRIVITNVNRGSAFAPPMPVALHVNLGLRTVTDEVGNPAWDVINSIDFFQLKPNGGTDITYQLGGASPSGTQFAQCAWYDAWL